MALHFVGFRDGSQLWRAMQIFGIPDFIHVKADTRFVFGGELDENDTVIFAEDSKADSLDSARTLCDDHTVDDSAVPEDKDSNILENKMWHFRPLTGQVPW